MCWTFLRNQGTTCHFNFQFYFSLNCHNFWSHPFFLCPFFGREIKCFRKCHPWKFWLMLSGTAIFVSHQMTPCHLCQYMKVTKKFHQLMVWIVHIQVSRPLCHNFFFFRIKHSLTPHFQPPKSDLLFKSYMTFDLSAWGKWRVTCLWVTTKWSFGYELIQSWLASVCVIDTQNLEHCG